MKRGYTLIELLVVVSIISVLAVGGIVAFSTFREERLAQAQADTIVSELRAAQRRALAGDKPSGCNSVVLQGYQIDVNAGSMDIKALCTGGTPTTRTVTLSGVVSNPQSIIFKVLNGATNPASINICTYNKLYSISVTGAGAVQQPVKSGGC